MHIYLAGGMFGVQEDIAAPLVSGKLLVEIGFGT